MVPARVQAPTAATSVAPLSIAARTAVSPISWHTQTSGPLSGSAIAGIIGHKTFQYDLCGDAVNTAARMCSTSEPGRVHVSEATYQLLNHRFDVERRGVREVKGKGRMETYFVHNAPPGSVSGKQQEPRM